MKAKSFLLIIFLLGSFLRPLVFALPSLETTMIRIDGKSFKAEVAQTPEQQQRGLQYRTELWRGRAMIFPYATPRPLSFWMKDCKIPLDMLFFRQGMLVDYVDSAPPCQTPDAQCAVYSSKEPADMVVELKAGTRRKFHFTPSSHLAVCPYP